MRRGAGTDFVEVASFSVRLDSVYATRHRCASTCTRDGTFPECDPADSFSRCEDSWTATHDSPIDSFHLTTTAVRFRVPTLARQTLDPALLVTALAFAALFAKPATSLVSDWLHDADAGQGLLLFPIALFIAWRAGIGPDARPNARLGIITLVAAVLIRYASGLAAELYTMRLAMVLAAAGLTIYFLGVQQVRRWWLPFTLAVLSVPLPAIVLNAAALPLQFKASHIGASLLEWRRVPVHLAGNVMYIPGHELFVATACSGLRSLSALVSLGLLLGQQSLRHAVGRVFVLASAIPVAIVVNGVRLFLTAFLMYYVSPDLGTGFMHVTEGWLLFLAAFAALASITWLVALVERRLRRPIA
jgi:exosortase